MGPLTPCPSRRLSRIVRALCALGAAGAPVATAHGQVASPAQVLVASPECDDLDLDIDETLRLLRIELRGDSVDHVEVVVAPYPVAEGPGRIAIIHLRVSPCTPDTTAVEAIVDDAVTRKRVRRSLELGSVPREVRARALALGVAELLRASWAELTRIDPLEPAVPISEETHRWLIAQARVGAIAPPERSVELNSPRPEPVVASEPPPPRPSPPLLIAAAAALHAFPADGTALVGARASLSLLLLGSATLRMRIDAGYERGRVRVALGDVAIAMTSAALAFDLSTDPGQPFVLEVGPRIEVGYGWARGSAVDPTDRGLEGGGIVALLFGHALLAGRLTDTWSAFADLELGHTLAGLDATVDGRSTTGIGGPSLALHLGVRVSL